MKIKIFLLLSLWFVTLRIEAIELRHDHKGNVLLLPFFTANNHWDSLINITITSGELAILKLRVRDGIDGKEVNSFNIYTFGGENWRAGIGKDENNNTILRIAEGSCTVANNLEFGGAGSTFNLGASLGSIEIYAVGARILFPGSVTNCEETVNRWRPQGIWLSNSLDGLLDIPTPLISAEMTLVNVKEGLAASYTATAFHEFKDKMKDQIPHTSPSDSSPTLAEATPVATLENGVDVVPLSGEGIDAVAMIMSPIGRSSITNDVVTENAIAASTDWVISYPLDGYKNYRPFSVSIDGVERHCETFNLPPKNGGPVVQSPLGDSNGVFFSWGQGKTKGGEGTLFDPPPLVDVGVDLCNAVNVLSFDGKPSILEPQGSSNMTNLSGITAGDASMLTMGFIQPFFPEQDVRRPVIGFRLTTFVNGTLDGGSVLANYAVLKPHLR